MRAADRVTAVDELSDSCVLLSAEACRSVPPDTPLSRVSRVATGKRVVATGALAHRFANYYTSERPDLVALVPEKARRVLDIGCCRGGYGRLLKRERPGVSVTGIELNPVLAAHAEADYDRVIARPLEEARLDERFHVVNMGDVIEHLYDPWKMLRKIHTLVEPGGHLVGSIPNVAHWSLVRALLDGDLTYIPFGLLCVGHIRFFTERTFLELLEETGFVPDCLERQVIPLSPEGERFVDSLVAAELGDRRVLTTFELVFRARKP